MFMIAKFIESLIAYRPVKFLISGGVAAIIEYVSFVLILVWFSSALIFTGQVISYLFGFIVSFYLQKKWVFKSKGTLGSELPKYTLLAGVNLILGVFVIWLLVNPMQSPPLIAKVIVMIMVALWNYVIFNKLIFNVTQNNTSSGLR